MEQEAEPVISSLKMRRIKKGFNRYLPFNLYKSFLHGGKIFLITSGKDYRYNVDNVATQPATLAAFVAIEKTRPDLLINAGTAGGFKKKGANIGDVYVGSGFKYHDRRIPISGFDKYGEGNYPAIKASKIIKELKLKSGIISTGNSLHATDEDLKIIKKSKAAVKEMEASAIAWVAMLYRKPFLALKSITNLVDTSKPTNEEFLNNLDIASRNLSKALAKVLGYCINKRVSDF